MKYNQSIKISFAFLLFYCVTSARPDESVTVSSATKRAPESASLWYQQGRAAVERARQIAPITRHAKNVILFVGDGMGMSTITAARILDGQQHGHTGEENLLSFDRLPYTAIIKTYSTDQQTPDSAGSMTAIVTGVKTRHGVISMDQGASADDLFNANSHKLVTILEVAEQRGLSTGVVTTTSVTHATPAACYAHVPNRKWESDVQLPSGAKSAGIRDIACQLIEFPVGDGLEVVLGGGRRNFLPQTVTDPEHPESHGLRQDGRNLIDEWSARTGSCYVWSEPQFAAIEPTECRHLLGLFEPEHMHFEHERKKDAAGEPSLSEMTAKAIDLLASNDKGFFLMVEGGRIDHAHHACNAFRALTETIEFSHAVTAALEKTDRQETLIIVTADHSHVFTMGGYARRGNAILGKVIRAGTSGDSEVAFARDAGDHPYTTLAYANGPGYRGPSETPDLSQVNTEDPDYRQDAMVPMREETHGGEDVPLFADGPCAYLFRGVLEQNVVFHVVLEAFGWTE